MFKHLNLLKVSYNIDDYDIKIMFYKIMHKTEAEFNISYERLI